MNKTNQQNNTIGNNADGTDGCGQTDTGLTVQATVDTMENPEFTAEQLPELWQQITEHDG